MTQNRENNSSNNSRFIELIAIKSLSVDIRSMRILFFLLMVVNLVLCPPANSQLGKNNISGENLGKRITVEGWAVDRKNGAQLVGTDFDLWIDGLSNWPEGYCLGKVKGMKVRVSGVLSEDKGLPVFIPKKNELPVQGIPVPEGTDVERAKHRYLLKNAHWELVTE